MCYFGFSVVFKFTLVSTQYFSNGKKIKVKRNRIEKVQPNAKTLREIKSYQNDLEVLNYVYL